MYECIWKDENIALEGESMIGLQSLERMSLCWCGYIRYLYWKKEDLIQRESAGVQWMDDRLQLSASIIFMIVQRLEEKKEIHIISVSSTIWWHSITAGILETYLALSYCNHERLPYLRFQNYTMILHPFHCKGYILSKIITSIVMKHKAEELDCMLHMGKETKQHKWCHVCTRL